LFRGDSAALGCSAALFFAGSAGFGFAAAHGNFTTLSSASLSRIASSSSCFTPTMIEMSSTELIPSTRDNTKPSRGLSGNEKTSMPETKLGTRAVMRRAGADARARPARSVSPLTAAGPIGADTCETWASTRLL